VRIVEVKLAWNGREATYRVENDHSQGNLLHLDRKLLTGATRDEWVGIADTTIEPDGSLEDSMVELFRTALADNRRTR
jgi:hypothetical protein